MLPLKKSGEIEGEIWIDRLCKPRQSSRSKLTTCPRKEILLRFESNSAAISDGGAQKLGNNVRRDSDSELIATKFCSQSGRKWNVMLKANLWPTSTGRALIFDCATDQPSITRSQRSVLNFKFSVLTFSRSELLDEHESNLCRIRQDVSIKGLCSIILVFRVWPGYSTWTILEQQSSRQKKSVAECEIQRLYTFFFQKIKLNSWLSG